MNTRGSQTIGWDVENRVISVTGGASFVYDGDGNRVKKTEGGNTTVYPNKYYEKNITSGEVTTNYYLGNKLIAVRKGTTLSYVMQEHLSSTSVIADPNGNATGTIKYFSFGATRSSSGTLPTDMKFTGQRLDSTGLYYYGARYYDANIGRFISPDIVISDNKNPQTLNRYSYGLNNPLKLIDPSGHYPQTAQEYLEYLGLYGVNSNTWAAWSGGGNINPQLPIDNPGLFQRVKNGWNNFCEEAGHSHDGYVWVTGYGWVYVGGLGSVTIDPKAIGHIYNNNPGHIATRTPQTDEDFLETASNPDDYVASNMWGLRTYAKLNSDGTQTWVKVWNNKITDAGVNQIPRAWNPVLGDLQKGVFPEYPEDPAILPQDWAPFPEEIFP